MSNGTHTQHYALQSRVRHSTFRTTRNSSALVMHFSLHPVVRHSELRTSFCSEIRSTRNFTSQWCTYNLECSVSQCRLECGVLSAALQDGVRSVECPTICNCAECECRTPLCSAECECYLTYRPICFCGISEFKESIAIHRIM